MAASQMDRDALINVVKGSTLTRPLRLVLLDRHEVELPQGREGRAEVPRLQRRRGRPRRLGEPRRHGERPAHAPRGHADRRVRDRRDARLDLRPRRVPARDRAREPRAAGVPRPRHLRRERARHRRALRCRSHPRRRRLRLRRRDGPHLVRQRRARHAAHQAAVPGAERRPRQAHQRQQRRDLRQRHDASARHARRRSAPSAPRRTAARRCSPSPAPAKSPAASKCRSA